MRILLAVAEPVLRSALRLVLEQQSWVDSVCESAESPDRAIDAYRCRADLLLFDLDMAGVRPETAFFDRVRRLRPSLKVVALSSHPEHEGVALAAGADGFVSKSDSPDRVLALLMTVAGQLV